LSARGFAVLSAKKAVRSPSLLISAFFNAFLQQIHEANPSQLASARQINWNLKHQFQKENVSRWISDFQPYDEHVEA